MDQISHEERKKKAEKAEEALDRCSDTLNEVGVHFVILASLDTNPGDSDSPFDTAYRSSHFLAAMGLAHLFLRDQGNFNSDEEEDEIVGS